MVGLDQRRIRPDRRRPVRAHRQGGDIPIVAAISRFIVIDTGQGAPIHFNRAVALICPACRALPGVGCVDLRYQTPRPRVTPHLEREQLIRDLDRQWAP